MLQLNSTSKLYSSMNEQMKILHSNAHLAKDGSCKHNEEQVQTGIDHVATLGVLSFKYNLYLLTIFMNHNPQVIAYTSILPLITTV